MHLNLEHNDYVRRWKVKVTAGNGDENFRPVASPKAAGALCGGAQGRGLKAPLSKRQKARELRRRRGWVGWGRVPHSQPTRGSLERSVTQWMAGFPGPRYSASHIHRSWSAVRLPQRGPGRSPGRKRILAYFGIFWKHFWHREKCDFLAQCNAEI